MLDYILSKMVLLIFLMLLVGAFASITGALDSFFIQMSAKNTVKGITERLKTIVGSVASSERSTVFVLPAYIKGQGRAIGYEVLFSCTKENEKVYVAFAVKSIRGKVLAYDGFAISKKGWNVTVNYCGFPAPVVGEHAKRYIVMERHMENSNMTVNICASENGSCSCKYYNKCTGG